MDCVKITGLPALPKVAANDQTKVLRFMSATRAYMPQPDRVEHIETHGAHIFLAGSRVFKIKRAVTLPYLDYGSLERRHEMCLRELEINRPLAPEIYRRVVSINADGADGLHIDGDGPAVEWAIEMTRFDDTDLLSSIARKGAIPDSLSDALATTVETFHRSLPAAPYVDGTRMFRRLIGDLSRSFRQQRYLAPAKIDAFERQAMDHLMRCKHCLDLRAERGFVRRCHGDLHADNVVFIDGRPVLFDALEFDEAMATIDLLYDIAFLLMDLMRYRRRRAANRVLNRYLNRYDDATTLYGLLALPLFLACRAAVRAMVICDRRDIRSTDDGDAAADSSACEIARYFEMALAFLRSVPAGLVAIGGFSGSGKTTLAASLAPHLGTAPGAIHLRTDIERKLLLGADEAQRLPPEVYTKENSDRVYDIVLRKAAVALKAGHSVVVDAVFGDRAERKAIEEVAANAGVPFAGIWLTAPVETMQQRVKARRGDASDATPEVVAHQLAQGTGPIAWSLIDCAAAPDETAAEALRQLRQSAFPDAAITDEID